MAKKNKRPESEAATQCLPAAETHGEIANAGSHEKDKKKKKKKKHNREIEQQDNSSLPNDITTVSIALPGTIMDNAQSFELATRLAGQIARAVTIFRIDEYERLYEEIALFKEPHSVVIFENNHEAVNVGTDSDEKESDASFLIRILRYLETPQYLRKALFPRHNSLRCVGLLPPLDAPHHLRKHEWAPYREGVTLMQQAPSPGCTLVDVGLTKNVVIEQVLEPGTRVTVAMGTNRHLDDQPRQIAVSSKPREELGMYWGYKVRYAANISAVLNCSPYKGGYDHRIGTSEHGIFVKSSQLKLPSFRHLLIAFGGLAGLEECIEEDKHMKGKTPREIFDSYLNVCPNQGSRTIRTEEAVFISLQYFQEPMNNVLHTSKEQQ